MPRRARTKKAFPSKELRQRTPLNSQSRDRMESKESAVGRINSAAFFSSYSRGKIYSTYTIISLIALLFAAPSHKNLSTRYTDEMDNYKLTQLRCRSRIMFCHDVLAGYAICLYLRRRNQRDLIRIEEREIIHFQQLYIYEFDLWRKLSMKHPHSLIINRNFDKDLKLININ